MTALVYLHGFLASPRSNKSRWLAAAARGRGVRFEAPDLNCGPLEVRDKLLALAQDVPADELLLVGASLGGFYARWLSARTGCRAVLLNPAVRPWEIAGNFLGPQRIFGEDRGITVLPEHPVQLRELALPDGRGESRLLAVLSTGDEVLPWTQAFGALSGAPRWVRPGGDHRVSDFPEIGAQALAFLFSGRLPDEACGGTLFPALSRTAG